MNIKEKYKQARPFIKNGDIVLFRGKHLLARLIQYFDSAYYNHAGVVVKFNDRFLILDSVRKGVKPDFLSERMNEYQDFCVLSPIRTDTEINKALDMAFDRGDSKTRYDFLLLPRIAILKKLKIDFTGWGSDGRDTCSEFAKYYTDCLNIRCYEDIHLISPEDFIRYRDAREMNISFNDQLIK